MEHNSIVDTVITDELRKLNSHLPKKKRSLQELLNESKPAVQTIRGEQSAMKKDELERLSALVRPEERQKVKLPFVLMRRIDLGPGAYELFGDPFEQYILARLIGSFNGDFEEFKRSNAGKNIFYRPQIVGLMKEIHSLIVLGFSTTMS